ncbi:MAG: cell division protein FtsA [Anaerolineae bacterium]|nr:cell division protein FtsA [Anaerolineae bacterium]
MERSVVGIDVGSQKIQVLVGEIDDAGVTRIVGVGRVLSRGVRKGVIVNVQEATHAISEAVERAEQSSGYHIERAYVGISGSHIISRNSQGVVGVARRDRGIMPDDVDRALEAAGAIALPQNQELLHIIPRVFTVDGQTGVRDPLGMHGFRLEVEAHVVMGASTAIQNLTKCVTNAGVEVSELVLNSLAAGGTLISDTEKDMGVVLVDIGEGTTDIAIFIEGTIWHTRCLAMGGEYITNDIAIGLRLPPESAERVKLQHGHAMASQVSEEDRFTVSPYGESTPVVVPRWKLAEIIQARAEEILESVQQEIKRSGYDGLLPAGLVLCGGTAQLPGIQDLARDLFGLPVQIGSPKGLAGLADKTSNPASAVSVGLVQWMPMWEERGLGGAHRVTRSSLWKRVGAWFRTLLPG